MSATVTIDNPVLYYGYTLDQKAKITVADFELWNHPLSVEARKLLGLNQFCDELCWDNSGLTDDMSVRLMNSLRHFEKIKVRVEQELDAPPDAPGGPEA